MRIKVVSIFGTRPEAIKMAPLVKALDADKEIESIVCVTAQHREMLDQVLEIFEIVPAHDLDIMSKRQTLTQITSRVLIGLEALLQDIKPDLILVHGDTTTTFVGALAAFYSKIKVGHVEAGLRTYNKYEPYPEEMNRLLTTRLTDIHFAPTSLSKSNLLAEGIEEEAIFVTGNTAIDVLGTTVQDSYQFKNSTLANLDFENKRIISVTAHRRENIGEPLENICKAILQLVETVDDVEVVYPVHPNPAVLEIAKTYLGQNSKIHLIEPLELSDMHNMLKRSYLVMTDSGGIQEEVPSLGRPVLVLRNVTERPEGVDAGTLKIAGTDSLQVYKLAYELLTNKEAYEKMALAKNPYGDGFASQRIVEAIKYYFKLQETRPKNFGL